MNHESMADCSANGYIIEVSSFKLPASLSPEAFAVLDKRRRGIYLKPERVHFA